MKPGCEISADRMHDLIAAALPGRGVPITDTDVPMKLALLAKIGVVNQAHGHLVPAGGTEAAAAAAVVDKYVAGDAEVTGALAASVAQLQQQVTELCRDQP